MPLGTEVGLGPGDIVLGWDPAPPQKGTQHPQFWSMSIVVKRLDGLGCHLVRTQASAQALAQATLVIGQTIIFLPCGFYLLSFFPRLISAVGDWMSTILPHMVWP